MEHQEQNHTRAVAARLMRRKLRRPLKVGVGALLAGVAALVLVGFRPLHVRRVEPRPSQGQHQVLEGGVESLVASSVGSPFDGSIDRLTVTLGHRVKRGELLFHVDTKPLEQELGLARGEASMARQSYHRGRAERDADLAGLKREVAALEAAVAQERELASRPQTIEVVVSEVEEDGDMPATEAVPAAVPDPARLEDLETRLAAAREQLAERAHQWDARLYETWTSYQSARREATRLQKLIAEADRRSPIDGVVTGIYAAAGNWVPKAKPVVRVDDPAGYRVVTLVDEKVRDGLKPGATLDMERAGQLVEGKLEKIVKGWDEQLLYHWLWLKPENPKLLGPGQKVSVEIPSATEVVAAN